MTGAERIRGLAGDGVGAILTEVARRRAAGRDVIALHVGEPEGPTPAHVVDAAVEALRTGHTHYTPVLGVPELRTAIARTAGNARGLAIEPSRVVVTPGAKMALHLAAMTLCGPDDEIVCLDPAYGAYAALGALAGATVRTVSQRIQDGFRLDAEQLSRVVNDRTRLLFLNSPCNPTGHILDHRELEDVADLMRRHPRLTLVSDEIYARIVYGPGWSSPLAMPGLANRTIVIDGVSKTYAMTGWRLGYAILPPSLVEDYGRIALHTFFCVSSVAQWAALEALTGPQDSVGEMVAAYRRRRDLLCDGIDQIAGLRCSRPDGAFYAFVDARELGINSLDLCLRLISQGGVATYPGSSFGAAGEGFIRLSFAAADDQIVAGLERIAEVVRDLRRRPVASGPAVAKVAP